MSVSESFLQLYSAHSSYLFSSTKRLLKLYLYHPFATVSTWIAGLAWFFLPSPEKKSWYLYCVWIKYTNKYEKLTYDTLFYFFQKQDMSSYLLFKFLCGILKFTCIFLIGLSIIITMFDFINCLILQFGTAIKKTVSYFWIPPIPHQLCELCPYCP